MSKEAMKLALDFAIMHHTDAGYTEVRYAVQAALREALAEQPAQQEPVKAMHIGFDWLDNKQLVATYAVPVAINLYAPALYTSPQQAQRTWVGLTDEEISLEAHNIDPGDWNDLRFRDSWHEGFKEGARAIEAKHSIKENT